MVPISVHGAPHTVIRNNVFDSVMTLYRTEKSILNEYPLYIAFDRERAIDLGGVSRDMFTAFFDEAFTISCLMGAHFSHLLFTITLPCLCLVPS